MKTREYLDGFGVWLGAFGYVLSSELEAEAGVERVNFGSGSVWHGIVSALDINVNSRQFTTAWRVRLGSLVSRADALHGHLLFLE